MRNNKTVLFENGLSIQLMLIIFLPINLIYVFKEKNKLNIIMILIGLALISSFSSRTIILSNWIFTALLIGYYYIRWYNNIENRETKKVATIVPIIIILLVIIIFVNIKDISKSIYDFLNDQGIYNRTLRLLSEGEYFSHSSGRTEFVYPAMIDKILESPIIGNGIGIDRIVINNYEYYAHNIVLELFVSYGILVGTIMLIGIVMLIIEGCKTKYKIFIIGMTFSGLFILMLTSSYTLYRGFWLLLAILINIVIKKEEVEI